MEMCGRGDTMVRVGIIGCGKIAQVRHIPEYLANPAACIEGYYDLDLKRAKELACQYGGKAYSSVEDLLKDPDIDAVSICVANTAHCDLTVQALRAGKHVLCEKPMAVTLDECEKMVAEADASGKKLMIGQNQRLAPAHIKAKALIKKGIIGDVLTFRSVFGHSGPDHWSIGDKASNWFFQKSKGAFGALFDLGAHKTDLIQYLLDSPITEVQALLTTLDKRYDNGNLIDVDDNAICIYRLENGAAGTVTASWTYYGGEDNSTVLYGTKGVMKLYEDPEHSIVIQLSNHEKICIDTGKIQTNDCQTNSGVIDAFIKMVTGCHDAGIPGKDVIPAMRAVFAAAKSAVSGRREYVQQSR